MSRRGSITERQKQTTATAWCVDASMAYGVRRCLGYERPTTRNIPQLPSPATTGDVPYACGADPRRSYDDRFCRCTHVACSYSYALPCISLTVAALVYLACNSNRRRAYRRFSVVDGRKGLGQPRAQNIQYGVVNLGCLVPPPGMSRYQNSGSKSAAGPRRPGRDEPRSRRR